MNILYENHYMLSHILNSLLATEPSILGMTYQALKALEHYAIFSAIVLLQLHSTNSLMLILSVMKSHHIGDSTIFSMVHNMSSIMTR